MNTKLRQLYFGGYEPPGWDDERNTIPMSISDIREMISVAAELLEDSLGDAVPGNDYKLNSHQGERWIEHEVLGSAGKLKDWVELVLIGGKG